MFYPAKTSEQREDVLHKYRSLYSTVHYDDDEEMAAVFDNIISTVKRPNLIHGSGRNILTRVQLVVSHKNGWGTWEIRQVHGYVEQYADLEGAEGTPDIPEHGRLLFGGQVDRGKNFLSVTYAVMAANDILSMDFHNIVHDDDYYGSVREGVAAHRIMIAKYERMALSLQRKMIRNDRNKQKRRERWAGMSKEERRYRNKIERERADRQEAEERARQLVEQDTSPPTFA